MFRKIFLLTLILFVFSSFVGAESFSIISPEEGYQHVPGEMEVSVESDFDLEYVAVFAICEGDEKYTTVVSQNIETQGVQSLTSKFAFIKEGQCTLFGYGTANYANGKFQTTAYSQEINFVSLPSEINESPVVIVRNVPDIIYPGGVYVVKIDYYLNEDYSGLIITEKVPEEMNLSEPALNNQGLDYAYDSETRELEIVLMGNPLASDKFTIYYYPLKDLESGTEVNFTGEYEVLEETGAIIGETTATVSGIKIPQCPISNQDLLGYIEQWSKTELGLNLGENDLAIMNIMGVWKSC
ncbi:MAG: hypothetical protein ABIA76_02355 [Candidatus Diapherotrites archaeon]